MAVLRLADLRLAVLRLVDLSLAVLRLADLNLAISRFVGLSGLPLPTSISMEMPVTYIDALMRRDR